MKNLSKYIFEKLLINKNYKSIGTVKPNNQGCCLELHLDTGEKTDLSISLKEYLFEDNTLHFPGYSSRGYKENNNGYFTRRYVMNISSSLSIEYIHVLLFGNDAKNFLNELLDDPEMDIDLHDELDNETYNELKWPRKVSVRQFGKNRPLKKAEIEHFLKKIY